MVDQASSLGSENTGPPSEMAVLLGDKFTELMTSYVSVQTVDIDNAIKKEHPDRHDK